MLRIFIYLLIIILSFLFFLWFNSIRGSDLQNGSVLLLGELTLSRGRVTCVDYAKIIFQQEDTNVES